jgi:hypothetical protein
MQYLIIIPAFLLSMFGKTSVTTGLFILLWAGALAQG